MVAPYMYADEVVADFQVVAERNDKAKFNAKFALIVRVPGRDKKGNPRTGKIGIQHPWCSRLMSYLRHPDRASEEELWSLGMFTHESMHVRGELNEAITECEAVQRNYRAAKLLGVPDAIARRNALDYYNVLYQQRGKIGGMQGAYYSDQCAPGKAMDEHLGDSTWATDLAAIPDRAN